MKAKPKSPTTRRSVMLAHLRSSALRGPVLIALGLALGVTGCQKAPQKPPEAPLKQAKKDDRIDEEKQMDLERRHLAPPPAYGNKVVMAKDEQAPTQHF